MRYFNKLSYSLLIVLAVSACHVKEVIKPVTGEQEIIFYPSFEADSVFTKTFLDSESKLKWDNEDEVSIFTKNTGNKRYKYNITNNTLEFLNGGNTITVLSGHYALYPYSAGNSISDKGVITTTFPALQQYVENSFGKGANPMAALSTSNKLNFRNLSGFLKLQLTGSAKITSIKIKGKSDEKLSGEMSVTSSDEPIIVMGAGAGDEVTLDCGAGVTLSSTATAFFIALPPTTFSDGFDVTITDDQGKWMTKSTTRSISISRNHIVPMASFAYESTGGFDYPFMNKTQMGTYTNAGVDINLYVEGSDQILTSELGSVFSFRLANTAEGSLLDIADIPTQLTVGNVFVARVTTYLLPSEIPTGNVTLKVVKKDDTHYWFLDVATEKGFIIEKI